jgi:hypothetical protein
VRNEYDHFNSLFNGAYINRIRRFNQPATAANSHFCVWWFFLSHNYSIHKIEIGHCSNDKGGFLPLCGLCALDNGVMGLKISGGIFPQLHAILAAAAKQKCQNRYNVA